MFPSTFELLSKIVHLPLLFLLILLLVTCLSLSLNPQCKPYDVLVVTNLLVEGIS